MCRTRGARRVLARRSHSSGALPSPRRLCLGVLLAACLGAAAQAGADVMFSGSSSGEKPQSKIFECDGSWWCVLDGPQGVAIYEKVGATWQIGAFADAILTPSGNADVKWTGTNLFVLVYSSSPKLYKYTYDGGLRVFALLSGFPVSLPNPSGSETMVLEQDTTGRLWTTAEGGGSINVYYSTSSDHRTWSSTPVVLQSGVGSDDISSIIAFGGKVGVFWSDQNRDQFGFRVHADTAAPTQWQALEIANAGPGYADDHINLAYDASGRVFAVTKDDMDRMSVHRRSTDGTWTTRRDITGVNGTRGIIMLSEADRRLYVLFTRWGVSPQTVQYVTADMDALSFQGPTTFITASSNLNNVTGTKGILPKGNLIGIASASSYHYNAFGSLQTTAPAPQNLVATLQRNPTRVLLGWDAPASGSPTGYNVYRQVDGGAFTRLNSTPTTARTFTDNAPPSAYVCYHVRAIAGTESAPSNTDCADARSLPPPGAPLNLTATLGASSSTVALSWGAPLTGGAVAGYHVFRSANGGSMQRVTTALVTGRSYTDSNPGLGQICYQVTAENIEQLAGPASNLACASIQAALGAPTRVTAIRDEISNGGGAGAAAYRMDEGSGGIATDATGSGHTAQLGSTPGADANDPTWVTGASGNALSFDGADYLRVTSTPALEFAGSFTLEAWVRRAIAGSTDCIVAKGGSDVRNYWMMLESDGTVDFRWETAGGANHGTRSTAIVEVGAWHHVACVYDMVAGQNRIYIDGKLVRASTDSGTPITNADPVYIGTRASGTSLASHFSGAIDLVRLSAGARYTSDFAPALAFGTQPIVRVSWDPPAQGSAAGYRVYRSIAGQLPTPLVTTPLVATSYIDLAPTDSACYRVSAIDALGQESAMSDAACPGVAPPGTIPIGPPTNVNATATLVGGGSVGGAAWYAMDEGAGASTADGTGAGQVAQLGSAVGTDSNDPAWIAGITGSGLDFDGSDYLRVQSTAALKLTGSFTLEAWVYRDLDGTTDCIVNKGDSDRRNYRMMVDTGGNIDFLWETSSGSNHGTSSTAKVSLNTWHHVACVYDQTAGQDRIYIDGVLVHSASDSGTPVTSDDPVYIGTRMSSGSLTSYFSGRLDLVRISPAAIYTANFTPPTQFGTTAPQPAVRVSWNAPANGGAVGYHVYRADNGAFTRINTAPLQETSYVDTAPAGTGCYRVTAVDAGSVESAAADACLGTAKMAAAQAAAPIVARFTVHPNPFNPSTRIAFDLPSQRDVVVELFDVRGRRIATLLRGQCEAGRHSVAWDGRDDHHAEVGSGTYFVRLNAGAFQAAQKLIVLK